MATASPPCHGLYCGYRGSACLTVGISSCRYSNLHSPCSSLKSAAAEFNHILHFCLAAKQQRHFGALNGPTCSHHPQSCILISGEDDESLAMFTPHDVHSPIRNGEAREEVSDVHGAGHYGQTLQSDDYRHTDC